MNIYNNHVFGDVKAFELGFGPVGRPFMNTYCYMIGDILIDTAQMRMRKAFIEIIRNQRIRHAVLTHHHEDHSGNAGVLKKLNNIPIYGHELTVKKMAKGFPILPYQLLIWGKADTVEVLPLPEKIEGERYTLIPVHTPGHSKDHTVFWEKDRGWLFSGDLFLGTKIKFFRTDESIRDSIDSIKKVLLLDFDGLFCGHNPQPINGKTALSKKLEFLEDLYGKVIHLLQKGYNERSIMKAIAPKYKEATFIKYMTFKNASFSNAIRSIERSGRNCLR